MPQLVLVRGISGSGKSTIANTIATAAGFEHFEADMFFIVDGVYKWDAELLGSAHEWCFNKTKQALVLGKSVVVANTFCTVKEVSKYTQLTKSLDVEINIINCSGNHKNIHDVPANVLEKQKARFVEDVSFLI
jgi:predicted kinase